MPGAQADVQALERIDADTLARFDAGLSMADTIRVGVESRNTMRAMVLCLGLSPEAGDVLSVSVPRPIYEQGRLALSQLLVVVFLLGFLAAATSVYWLDRLLL